MLCINSERGDRLFREQNLCNTSLANSRWDSVLGKFFLMSDLTPACFSFTLSLLFLCLFCLFVLVTPIPPILIPELFPVQTFPLLSYNNIPFPPGQSQLPHGASCSVVVPSSGPPQPRTKASPVEPCSTFRSTNQSVTAERNSISTKRWNHNSVH